MKKVSRKFTKQISSFILHTFDTNEKALPADEVIPVKCAFKAKLNSYGGLDKLKARICVRGDMQIKDIMNNWSPTASVRLLKCFLADAIRHESSIYQLDFIQAFNINYFLIFS